MNTNICDMTITIFVSKIDEETRKKVYSKVVLKNVFCVVRKTLYF